jgi:hypothetical protein
VTARNRHPLTQPSLASARVEEVCLRNKLHRKRHCLSVSCIQLRSFFYQSTAFFAAFFRFLLSETNTPISSPSFEYP